MDLVRQLTEYISACFTGVWLQSHEREDALAMIAGLCRQENWRLALWDIERGLQIPGQENSQTADAEGSDPLAAIRCVNALASADGSALLLLVNFHRFLQSAEIVQALAQQIATGKANRTFILILSPLVAIPTELEKLFVVLEPQPLAADKLPLVLKNVKDTAGNALDGEWTNGASTFPSGDAVPGGDFAYRINVLPGDVTQDGLVISNDLAKVNLAIGTSPGHPVYSVWMDVTGDAMIISNDLAKVTSKLGTALPAGEPLPPMPQLVLTAPLPIARPF